MSLLTLDRAGTPATEPAPVRSARRPIPWYAIALAVVLLCQVALALRPASRTPTPFDDEGLYIYMGHRMIQHLLHGTLVTDYPGTYFSGAPGFYPVLAALGDDLGGLEGARDVSLLFALGATICVNGLGRELYGRVAGLLGATAFVLCGSTIYVSHFATYDSCTMFFFAAAAWLTVRSSRNNRYIWAPVVSALMVASFYAKYAGGAYLPIVAGLALATARPGERMLVLRRTVVMVITALVLGYFIFALWGQSLLQGIEFTTVARQVAGPVTSSVLLHDIGGWVGPWLVLAALGAVVTWRKWLVAGVLLAGVVLGPGDQIRIGEQTSLDKHVAFSMVFACPLIGALFARLLLPKMLRLIGIPILAVTLGVLAQSGLKNSHTFLTAWADDRPLIPVLDTWIRHSPGLMILGENPHAAHYALWRTTNPVQWQDTFGFEYDHKSNKAAYKEAIDQSAFGVIFLARSIDDHGYGYDPTPYGQFIYSYLDSGHTPYELVATVSMLDQGRYVGSWQLFARTPTKSTAPTSTATPEVQLSVSASKYPTLRPKRPLPRPARPVVE